MNKRRLYREYKVTQAPQLKRDVNNYSVQRTQMVGSMTRNKLTKREKLLAANQKNSCCNVNLIEDNGQEILNNGDHIL